MNGNLPKILGIDPGSRCIGFALIGARKLCPLTPKDWSILDIGVMKADTTKALRCRIGDAHEALFGLIEELKPNLVSIEKAFHGVNAATAIKLGEARGALIAAVSRHKLDMHEITPAEVKKLIAGHGAAEKERVYQALQSLMGYRRLNLPYDASDALAIALATSLQIPKNYFLDGLSKQIAHPEHLAF